MRVLHCYSGNLYGGVEAMLAAIARQNPAVPEVEHHFALAWTDGRLGRELAEIAPGRLHGVGAVRLRDPFSVRRARRRLGAVLDRVRPGVVVCHSAWSQAVFGPVARRRGHPLVFWLHDAAGVTLTERLAGRVRPELAICTSAFVAGTLPRLYAGMAGAVVHPMVAPPPPGMGAAGGRLRAELGVADGEVVFVQVARMEGWKGHAVLLEALARMRGIEAWRCWMVGGAQRPEEASYLQELRARADRLGIAGRVSWLGERADVPAVMAAADVCVQPNLSPEPFGMAMVEALYAGRPVVAADHGGAREVVDRGCGVRFRPGDDAALSDALRALMGPDLRERLGAAGPSRAVALCDPRARLRDLARLLTPLARGSA